MFPRSRRSPDRCGLAAGAALLLSLAASSCAGTVRVRTGAAVDPGASRIAVTLEAVGGEAARLTLRFASVSAVREDERTTPVPIAVPMLAGTDFARGRLLAFGGLPGGTYKGISVLLERASLTTEHGAAELRVPEEPRLLPVAFTVSPRSGAVVSLTLNLQAALGEGYRFDPAFVARLPERPPAGLIGYAALPDAGALLAFNKRSGSVTGLTPLGRSAGGIALDPARRRAYVTLPAEDAMAEIDLEQGAVIQIRPLRGGDHPVDLALTPDGTRLVVANEGSATVAIVDPDGLIEIARTPVGDGPRTVTIDSTGARAYIPCARANRVDVVDVARGALAGSIPADAGPLRVQLSRQEDRLFVIHDSSPQLLVADPKSQMVVRRIFVGGGQQAVKLDRQTDRLYLAREGTGVIEVFDPHSLLAIDRIQVPATPAFLTIDGDDNTLVASIPDRRELLAIGLVSRTPAVVLDTGWAPGLLALSGER